MGVQDALWGDDLQEVAKENYPDFYDDYDPESYDEIHLSTDEIITNKDLNKLREILNIKDGAIESLDILSILISGKDYNETTIEESYTHLIDNGKGDKVAKKLREIKESL